MYTVRAVPVVDPRGMVGRLEDSYGWTMPQTDPWGRQEVILEPETSQAIGTKSAFRSLSDDAYKQGRIPGQRHVMKPSCGALG